MMHDVVPMFGSKTTRTYLKDLAERVFWTFAWTAVSVAIAAGPANWVDISVWKGAAIAGVVAAGSLVTGAAARFIGDKNSASTLPGI